jgi:hypothetical protein
MISTPLARPFHPGINRFAEYPVRLCELGAFLRVARLLCPRRHNHVAHAQTGANGRFPPQAEPPARVSSVRFHPLATTANGLDAISR